MQINKLLKYTTKVTVTRMLFLVEAMIFAKTKTCLLLISDWLTSVVYWS